jgi:hypothetical protein
VVDEALHDYTEFNTIEKALHWIGVEAPYLANRLEGFEVMDFLGLRNSPGSNLIGYANSIITQLIANYLSSGEVNKDRIDFYNQFIIFQNDWLVGDIQSAYPYFGNSQVESLRYIWDIFVGWTMAAPQMFNSIYLDEQKTEKLQHILFPFYNLAYKVRKLFSEWSKVSRGTFSFQYFDYLKIPFIKELYDRCLQKGKTIEQIIEDHTYSIRKIEEFVQVLFQLILEDCMPEKLEKITTPFWINPYAVSLSVDLWEKDGLFAPKDPIRDYSDMNRQIRSLYTFQDKKNGTALLGQKTVRTA